MPEGRHQAHLREELELAEEHSLELARLAGHEPLGRGGGGAAGIVPGVPTAVQLAGDLLQALAQGPAAQGPAVWSPLLPPGWGLLIKRRRGLLIKRLLIKRRRGQPRSPLGTRLA